MSEYIVDTFGIVQDFANLHGDMNTPLYQAIMNVMVSRQREQIVRCRDCKHYAPVKMADGTEEHRCSGVMAFIKCTPETFCAWAVNRTEAESG